MSDTKEKKQERSVGGIYALAALVVVVAGLIFAKPIIVPILLSAFIAIVCSPALFMLEKLGLPRILSFIIVLCVAIGVLVGVGAILGNSINDFTHNLPHYQDKLEKLTASAVHFAEDHKIPVSKTQILKRFDPASLLSFGGYMLSGLGSILSQAMLIFVTVAFMLFETSTFERKLTSANLLNPKADTPLDVFTGKIKRYLAIKTLTSLGTALLVIILLLITGVDYPYLWGMLAFFLNFVPTIGAFLAAVPVVLMALIQYGPGRALGVAIAYTVINVFIGNFVEPRFMGKGLGLSPLVVFLSLIVWGFILGPAGMFLSVPLTMTLKIACDSREKTKWIGVLLGP